MKQFKPELAEIFGQDALDKAFGPVDQEEVETMTDLLVSTKVVALTVEDLAMAEVRDEQERLGVN